MNTKLQDAIVATRAGNKREAQLLLTELLKEDQEDVQAWFLLSNLVDSESKKQAYLGKVLAINPNHDRAQRQLARLQLTTMSEAPTQITKEPTTATPDSHDEDVSDLLAAMSDSELTLQFPSTMSEPDEEDEPPTSTAIDDLEDTAIKQPATSDTIEPTSATEEAKPTITPTPTTAVTTPKVDAEAVAQLKARYDFWIRILIVVAFILVLIIAFYLYTSYV